MFEGDLVEAGEEAAAEAGAAEGGDDVHALHLGDLGVEVADAAEAGGILIDVRQQEDPVRWRKVGRRAGGDLSVEVDPRLFPVVDQRPVGLADEVGIQRLNLRIVTLDRLEGKPHGNDANGLQIFSILRTSSAEIPGTIRFVNRKELSEVVAECAAITQRAAARTEEARAGVEAARKRQEEAIARQEAVRLKQEEAIARQEEVRLKQEEAVARQETVKLKQEEAVARQEAVRLKQEEAVARQEAATARIEEMDARWREQTEEYREWNKRQEKALQEQIRRTDEIVAELRDGRDERRAMLEALFKLMDRLPPPPPNLRSA